MGEEDGIEPSCLEVSCPADDQAGTRGPEEIYRCGVSALILPYDRQDTPPTAGIAQGVDLATSRTCSLEALWGALRSSRRLSGGVQRFEMPFANMPVMLVGMQTVCRQWPNLVTFRMESRILTADESDCLAV